MKRYKCPLAPMLEENLCRSLMRSRGSFAPFVTSPIAVVFLAATVAVLVLTVYNEYKKNRK